jgi:hypothetical protein
MYQEIPKQNCAPQWPQARPSSLITAPPLHHLPPLSLQASNLAGQSLRLLFRPLHLLSAALHHRTTPPHMGPLIWSSGQHFLTQPSCLSAVLPMQATDPPTMPLAKRTKTPSKALLQTYTPARHQPFARPNSPLLLILAARCFGNFAMYLPSHCPTAHAQAYSPGPAIT